MPMLFPGDGCESDVFAVDEIAGSRHRADSGVEQRRVRLSSRTKKAGHWPSDTHQ